MKSITGDLINIPSHLSKKDALDYLFLLRSAQVKHLIRISMPASKHSQKPNIDKIVSSDSLIAKIDNTILSLQKITDGQ